MTFSIDIHQDTLVKKLKPAVVKVYDYYEPGKNENILARLLFRRDASLEQARTFPFLIFLHVRSGT